MNRSVRNGIAVAGMAGGLWFLGHAVANADEGQTASADNTTSTSQTGSGSSSNDSTNVAKAANDNSTSVSTGNITGGNGGTNTASINTGVTSGGGGITPATSSPSTSSSGGGGGGGTTVNASSGSVSVTQQANGGSVSGSGNVTVNSSVRQSASASNNVTQSSTSSGDSHDGHRSDGHDSSSTDGVSSDSVPSGGGEGHGGGNDSTTIAVAHNDNSTDVSTGNIRGGSGGLNEADVNTGLLLEPVYASVIPLSDSQSDGGRHRGEIDITLATGAVWVRQEANGGDVSGSGNVDVNGNVHQSASASNDVTQTSTSADRRKHGRGNDSTNVAVAANDNSTYVDTGNIRGGSGGVNLLDVNTGAIVAFFPVWEESGLSTFDERHGDYKHHESPSIDVTVSTGDVSATQEANGGDVSGSGNVSVCTSADQSASASNDVTQNSTAGEHHGRNGNRSTNIAIADNDNSTEVYTGNIRGGSGGVNQAEINTGAILEPVFLLESLSSNENDGEYHHHHNRNIDVTVSTGDVSATQEANGGDVSGSGNVSVSSSANQSASASNDLTQNSTSGDHHGRTGNRSTNIAIARNDNATSVATGNIRGGNGGDNFLEVNTGLIGSAFFGGFPSSLDVTTGDVTVNQEANGGNVRNSGNVSVGNKGECGCQKAAAPTRGEKPGEKPGEKRAEKPAEKPATVETVKKAAVTSVSSAQPTGTLAVTGADTSAPLTAGLLALGAGAALTLAGRRRRDAQDV